MTAKKLIEILREDFSCTLKTEKIIGLINNIEKLLFNEGLVPQAKSFTVENADQMSLSLGGEHSEVYIYHILSREALLRDDIDRLNNFSTLYAKVLSQVPHVDTASVKFKNIW